MALSGKFLADFSSFYDAAQKATVSIKSIGESASKVGPQLNRMVDQFSGKKVIADATLMARAVEELGGVSKLTESEMKRVGATMAEAMAKMRATGVDIPKNMQAIASATKDANKAGIDWMGTLTKIGGAFGIAFSAQALVGFVKGVFDAAGAIKDLSTEWGVSAEAAQKFTQAAELSGATAQDVGAAINFMSRELGEGSKQYQALVEGIGLSFDELRRMSPEQAFRTMVQAVQDIEDPLLQADWAVKLFGKSAQSLLPAMRDDFLSLADSQKVMSNETVARLEEAGDAWQHFTNQVTIWTGELLGTVTRNMSVIFASWGNFGTVIKKAVFEGRDAAVAWIKTQDDAARATDAHTRKLSGFIGPMQTYGSMLRTTTQVLGDQKDAEDRARKAQSERQRQLEEITRAQEAYAASNRKIIDDLSGGAALDKASLWLQRIKETIPLAQMTQATQAAVNKTMTEALEVYAGLGETAPQAMIDIWLATLKPVPVTRDLTQAMKDLAGTSVQVELFARQLTGVNTAFAAQGPLIEANRVTLEKSIPLFKGFGDYLKTGLGPAILGAFQGGGNVLKTIGAGLGGAAMAAGSGIATKLTAGLSGTLGKTLGGALGSVVPVVGTLLGGLAGGMFSKIFGQSERSKIDEQFRGPFIAAAGGLEVLNAKAAAAGVTLNAMLDASKPAQYEAALKALNDAFVFQEQSMATLNETAQRYGFTIEELGPAMQRQELDKQAQQLFKDWEVLNAAGIDTVAITSRMSDSVNEYLHHAIAMGVEVPAAMRPMLEEMARMGKLTDASGNKITDLEAAGISFSMTMSEGFKSLIAEVSKLTDAIARGLGIAIDKTTNSLNNMPHTVPVAVVYDDPGFKTTQTVKVKYDTSGKPSGGSDPVESYQGGTDGFRNFGTGTPVMLHGWEAVVPRDHVSTAGADVPLLGGAGVTTPTMTVNVVINGSVLSNRDEIARVVGDALTHSYRAGGNRLPV